MIFLGLDPGASGGIAWIYDSGTYCAAKWADTERGVVDQFSDLTDQEEDLFAVIEDVHAFPGQGVSSVFTFGRGYGFLRACLHAFEIPFESVAPTRWQRALGLVKPKLKDAKPAERSRLKALHKRELKARAEELFPKLKVTLATADALLLAEFCRITRASTLQPAEAK